MKSPCNICDFGNLFTIGQRNLAMNLFQRSLISWFFSKRQRSPILQVEERCRWSYMFTPGDSCLHIIDTVDGDTTQNFCRISELPTGGVYTFICTFPLLPQKRMCFEDMLFCMDFKSLFRDRSSDLQHPENTLRVKSKVIYSGCSKMKALYFLQLYSRGERRTSVRLSLI